MKYEISYQKQGEIKTKIYDAPSQEELEKFYKLPKNIIAIKQLGNHIDIASFINKFDNRISDEDIIELFAQIQTMLHAHLSISECVSLLKTLNSKKPIQDILSNMHKTLQEGKPIYTALEPFERQVGIVPILFLKLSIYGIEIKDCIDALVVVLKQNKKSRDKIIQALSYSFVLFMSLIICMVVIIIYVLPNFESIFAQLKGNLPLPTTILLSIRDVFVFYYPLILFFIGVCIGGFWYLNRNYTWHIHKFLATKLWIISSLLRTFISYRLFVSISVLLKAKYNFQESLKQANLTTSNKFIFNEVGHIAMAIKKGMRVDKAFEDSILSDDITCKLLAIAQNTGHWERCLNDLVKIYNKNLNKQIKTLSAVIEPAFIFILAGVILWLVMAVMLPMWSLGDSLG